MEYSFAFPEWRTAVSKSFIKYDPECSSADEGGEGGSGEGGEGYSVI